MRTLVAAILLATLIVTGVAIVVPLIARPMIVAAVQAASPFGDQPLDIDVECNVFGLLTGTVDRIRLRGTHLARGDVKIAAVDVTLWNVATSGHAYADSSGHVADIQVPMEDGSTLPITTATLQGSSSDMTALINIDTDATKRLIRSVLADGGIEATDVLPGNGVVSFEAFGTQVFVPVSVEAGAIVLVEPFGNGSFELIKPGPNDAWQIARADLSPDGLRLDVIVDVERLLTSS